MEIKVNYWPSSPNFREVKIYYHNNLIVSCFCDKEQIKKMIDNLTHAYHELKDISDE